MSTAPKVKAIHPLEEISQAIDKLHARREEKEARRRITEFVMKRIEEMAQDILVRETSLSKDSKMELDLIKTYAIKFSKKESKNGAQ